MPLLPVLRPLRRRRSVRITENPTANNGDTVTSRFSGNSIAVTVVDDTNGDWQYSTDSGSNWNSFSGASGSSVNIASAARLLNTSAKIRFVPNADWNGNATITYRTWNGTTGTNGGTADASSGGGAFSASTATATVTVTAVNDALVLSAPSAITLTDTAAVDTFSNQTGTLSATDAEGTTPAYGISGGTTGGSTVISSVTYDVSKAGTYGTLYVKSSGGQYVFVADATAINARSASASESFTLTASDGSLTGSNTLTVNVTGANDTPTRDAISNPAAINEDASVQTVNLSGIGAGGGESQSLSVSASTGNTALIPHPSVNYTSANATGSLSYTPVADQSGSAAITVT